MRFGTPQRNKKPLLQNAIYKVHVLLHIANLPTCVISYATDTFM